MLLTVVNPAETQAAVTHGTAWERGLSWRPQQVPINTWLLFNRSVESDSLRPHGLGALQAPPSMGFSRQEYWSGICLCYT